MANQIPVPISSTGISIPDRNVLIVSIKPPTVLSYFIYIQKSDWPCSILNF